MSSRCVLLYLTCGERTIQEIVSDFEREGDLIGAARFLDFLGRFDEAQAMMTRTPIMDVSASSVFQRTTSPKRSGRAYVPYLRAEF